jgi:hypothetical protein
VVQRRKKPADSKLCARGTWREERSGESNSYQPFDLLELVVMKGGYQYMQPNQRLKVTLSCLGGNREWIEIKFKTGAL